MSEINTRKYDVILWGATGFTGKIVAQYLKDHYSNGNLKWAIAGRNKEKLANLAQSFLPKKIDFLEADAKDLASLNTICSQTKVMCTTVGPYTLYGDHLVKACIESKTHYCDLTGEVLWMRKNIAQYHEIAKKSRIKIVHSCGFDSIPSDMGVYALQNKFYTQNGMYAEKIMGRVRKIKGSFSGGTYASMSHLLEQIHRSPELKKTIADPYALITDPTFEGPKTRDLTSVKKDSLTGQWMCPFIMAGINTKVVRRSHFLNQYRWGEKFEYQETLLCGHGTKGKIRAWIILLVLGLFTAAKPNSVLKRILDRIMPKPGEGPQEKDRKEGYFTFSFYAKSKGKETMRIDISSKEDPGYGATSKMLAESAICLALDKSCPDSFGVLTPSQAMGDCLLKRLEDKAGIKIS
jgi:short subunit dehydrogenase-like uncharacterized protein